MHISIGNYQFTLKKGTPQALERNAAQMIAGGLNFGINNPFINTYDSPRQNLNYIRETVSNCMHARSEAIGRGRFHAYEETRSKTGLFVKTALPIDHPLERLLHTPNPLLDMNDLLELSSQWLDATGNSLMLKVRNVQGNVIELWPIAALSFQIEKGSDEMPGFYHFLPNDVRIPAQDIVHIRRADIRTAPFTGHAILSDILETAKADTAIRLFQERFFMNDATPRAVLRFPQGAMMTQDQMDQLRNAWESKYGSPVNAGRIGILPDGGEVQLLGSTAKELDFTQSRKNLRDAIREAFKVPQIVLGDVEAVNLSNAETSYNVFLRDVVDYALAKHARAFTRALAREFSREALVEHDSVLPQNEDLQLRKLHELKDCLTVDEQRAMLGFGGRVN